MILPYFAVEWVKFGSGNIEKAKSTAGNLEKAHFNKCLDFG